MANLVPIPWQPGYYLTPDTLAYLKAAGNKLQTNLLVTDAWRSYAEQAYYYDQYKNHGGNPASSPDTGLRQHMRGAAFDLQRTDATVQAACVSVGLKRDYDEAWHWNNPYWATMPIIPTNDTTTAGGDATPIDNEDEDMPLTDADISKILNSAAFTGGPTISQALKDLYYAQFYGLPAMKDGGKSVSQSLADINKAVNTPVMRDGKAIPQIQDNADGTTYALQILTNQRNGTKN